MSDSQIHFFRDGVHTHLVLPACILMQTIPALKDQLQDCLWARIGWGDIEYYGSPQQTYLGAIRALFLPSAAVMGVLGFNDIHAQVSDTNRVYSINSSQTIEAAVAGFIADYFKQDPQGQLTQVREKPNGEAFFKAHGIYMFINTCNNWTSRGLRIAGLRCLPLLNFFPGQVEKSVRRNGYLPLL
jgi:uncharacterized protein (TIGR02117 family)|tara:strand:- start:4542 stop:5096 length:555 start_codon:yes stop_codon:yes gene_type:complete